MKADKLRNTRRGHWYQFGEGELAHSFFCIAKLKSIGFAKDLVAKTGPAIELLAWLQENKDCVDTPEWLAKWWQLEGLRTSLFEVRYAYDLYKQGVTPDYEAKTIGDSSVDFKMLVEGSTFLVELVSSQQTDAMTKNTEHLTEHMRIVGSNPAEELRKIQSKIVRKVAQKIEREDTEEYKPHKFPAPANDGSTFNVIIADTRGFNAGDHLQKYERIQLVWGAHEYLRRGGPEIDVYMVGNQLLAGLFDQEKLGEEARLFRERIHLLGLVSEETFGEGVTSPH